MSTNSVEDFAKQYGKTTSTSNTNNGGTNNNQAVNPVSSFAGQYGNGQGSKAWYSQQQQAPAPVTPTPKPNVFQKIGNFISSAFSNINPRTETLKSIQSVSTPEVKTDIKIQPNLTVPEVDKSTEANQSAKVTPEIKNNDKVGPIIVNTFKSITDSLSEGFPQTAEAIKNIPIAGNPKNILTDIWSALKQPTIDAINQFKSNNEISKKSTGAEVVAKSVGNVVKTAGIIFTPINVLLAGANDVPGLSNIVKVATLGFTLIGESAQKDSDLIIDSLPISQKSKETLKPAVGEASSLLAQILLGKYTEIKSREISPIIKKMGNDAFEKLTKNMIDTTGVDKTIRLTADQIKQINLGTGDPTSADLVKSLGLSGKEWSDAVKNGLSVDIPAEKITRIVDKPYWEKIKGIFGQKATDRTVVNNGEVTKNGGFGGYLPENAGQSVETPKEPPKKTFTKQELPTVEELNNHKEQLINTIVQEKLAGNDQFVNNLIDRTNTNLSDDHFKALESAITEADKRVAEIQGKTTNTEVKPAENIKVGDVFTSDMGREFTVAKIDGLNAIDSNGYDVPLKSLSTWEKTNGETPKLEKMDYDPNRLEVKIFNPQTAANPTDKFSVQVRYKGWAAEEKFFDTKKEADNFVKNYQYKGLDKSVIGEYQYMKKRFPDFPIDFKDTNGGEIPKTVRTYRISPISKKAFYEDVPVIREEKNITLYQGSKPGENRQFWTPNKKYASKFGEVREKTGDFYKIDNGNMVTDVYVEAKPQSSVISTAKPEEVKAVFGKNKGLPILDNIQIKDGKMNFTDLDHYVSLDTDKENGLYKLVGKDLIKENNDGVDFPEFINEEQKPVFSILRNDLVDILNKTIPVISKDSTRPILGTVHFEIKSGKINIVATDGFKLVYKTVNAKIPENVDTQFNIEGKNLNKFIKLLNDSKIDVSEGAGSVKFTGEGGFVEIRKTLDEFPNASLPYSIGFKNEIIIDKSELNNALKEISSYAKNHADVISVDIKGDELVIHSEYEESYNSRNIIKKDVKVPIIQKEIVNINPGIVEGALIMPVRLEEGSEAMMAGTGLNYKYLEDSLKTISGNQVRIDYNELGDLTPVHLSDRTESNIKSPETIKEPKAPSVPKNANASAGSETIGDFEEVPVKNESNNFKLYTKVGDLIDKYAKTIGEGYLPKRAAGVFYTDTKNIRINGMNNLSVATHEITHFLDDVYKISNKLRVVVGKTADGKPIYDSSTKAIRKEITNLYTEYYSGGKKTDPLQKRVVEGLATLIQKYVEQPTTIEQKYPNLVTEFLKENGRFYEPVIGEILKDVKGFIAEYKGLDPLDKIGARVTSKNVVYDKPSFMKLGDKIREQIADRVYPIEKLSKLTKTVHTQNDTSLYVRQYQQINGIIANNLIGKHGYFRYVSGSDFQKTLDFNWKNLIKNLANDKTTDSFGYYLVARASYYDYQLLNEYKENFLDLKNQVEEAGGIEEAKKIKSEDKVSLFDQYNQAKTLMEEQESMLKRDGITEKEASEAYLQNKDRFAKDELMYDQLVAQDLQLLHEPDVGLISDKTFEDLSSKKGYASRKRQFFDEIVGEDKSGSTQVKIGKTRISSLIKRTGSSRTIINPVYSSIRNHSEIVKKAYRQVVYNKMNNVLAPLLPELAQKQQLIRSVQKNGSFRYPQERDPNIIMGRINGKRVPVLWDSYVKSTLDDLITPANYGTFENILLSISRMFTKGTTGLFPSFALTNWLGDQITAVSNTTNNYKPLVSSLNQMSKAIFKKDSPEANYFLEYTVLGGERQTFAHWQDLSPQELSDKIANERKGLLKVADLINGGLDILSIPSSYSEIATRATEYIKSRKNGNSQIVALEEAGRITAPFHHVGKWGGNFGRVIIKALPFFNPSIQVLEQTIRTSETPAGRSRIAFVLAAITAANIAAFALMMNEATDDQKRTYKDLEAAELAKYIWLPSNDGKTLIKIKVQEFGILGSLINLELANKYLNAGYKAPDFISGAEQILPNQFQLSDPMLALLAWIPPAVKVPLMTGLNIKDYPKILPIENTYLQGLPSGLRANESTSYMSKKVGELTGLSPVKTDYFITGIFGRSSGFILGKSAAYNPLSQVTRAEYWTSGRTIQGYYDLKTKNDQDFSAINNKVGSFTTKEKNNILILHQRILTIDKFLKQYRDVDLEKNPQRANDLRNSIINQINQLNDVKDKQTSFIPLNNKSVAFKLVKDAYAAENLNDPKPTSADSELKRKIDLTKFLNNIRTKFKIKSDSPVANYIEEKLVGTRKELYDTMLQLRQDNFEWYKQNISQKDETAVLGFDLNTQNLSQDKDGQLYLTKDFIDKTMKIEPEVSTTPASDSNIKDILNTTKEITGSASYYNPTNPKETKPNANGIGAYGRTIESGSVAMGNRDLASESRKGKVYIQVTSGPMAEVKTPYGIGIYRVDDTMNQRYSNTNNIDFNAADLSEAQKRKGRFDINYKIFIK